MKTELISSSVNKSNLLHNIGQAIIAGFWGYILFLGILFLTKIVSTLVQTNGMTMFESADFLLPIIGFILLFLIKMLENFKEI